METTIFNVNTLSANQALELKNWLASMPGVDDVAIDVGGSKVTVIYDPATTDRGSLRTSMASVGVLLQ
jgi:copper chaperone CopZ